MKKNKVWTSSGLLSGNPTSLVGKNESIINYHNGTATYIDKGKRGVDDQPSDVKDSDTIAGNKPDFIGFLTGKTNRLMTFADQVAPLSKAVQTIDESIKKNKNAELSSLYKQTLTIQNREADKVKQPLFEKMKDITDRQAQQNQIEQAGKYQQAIAYAGGKDDPTMIPWYTRMLPNAVGIAAGLGQLGRWSSEPVKYHNTYAESPYSKLGLNKLASLHDDAYNEIRSVYDAERRAAYANEAAPGLTGSQRYTGRIALGLGAMQTAANAYSNRSARNNAFKQQYANALLTEGNQIASRRQSAAQHDWADFVNAHGRKTKGIETAVANILNQVNSGYANEFKYRTWRDTANLYRQQMNQEQENFLAEMKSRGFDKNGNQIVNVPTIERQKYAMPAMTYTNPLDSYVPFKLRPWTDSVSFGYKPLNIPNYYRDYTKLKNPFVK